MSGKTVPMMGVVGTTGVFSETFTTGTNVDDGKVIFDEVVVKNSEIEALKVRVAELEKKENNRADLEYFQRNLHKALKIPEHVKLGWNLKDRMSRLEVGPNDILLIHFNIADVPSNRVEAYMKKAKGSLATFFEERGLKGRTLWVSIREGETSFSVIHITKPLTEADVAEARRIRRATRAHRPPVMG